MTSPILFLALSLTSQARSAGPGWVEGTSRDNDFTFAMPGKAAERVTTQPAANGPIEVLEYSCLSGDCQYRVEKSKLPIKLTDEKRVLALGGMRDSIARKTKLIEDRETTVAGWPARELTVEAPLRPGAGPSRIAMLILYDRDNLYQVRVFALKPGTEPKDVRKFFDAFRPKVAGAGPKGKS